MGVRVQGRTPTCERGSTGSSAAGLTLSRGRGVRGPTCPSKTIQLPLQGLPSSPTPLPASFPAGLVPVWSCLAALWSPGSCPSRGIRIHWYLVSSWKLSGDLCSAKLAKSPAPRKHGTQAPAPKPQSPTCSIRSLQGVCHCDAKGLQARNQGAGGAPPWGCTPSFLVSAAKPFTGKRGPLQEHAAGGFNSAGRSQTGSRSWGSEGRRATSTGRPPALGHPSEPVTLSSGLWALSGVSSLLLCLCSARQQHPDRGSSTFCTHPPWECWLLIEHQEP